MFPELELTKVNIPDLLDLIVDEETLVVTDSFGLQFTNRCQMVVTTNENPRVCFKKVVAVGGCTSLDKGRSLAVGKKIIVVPTILSTSCISVNRSVLPNGKIEKTIAPVKTIVCIPEIVKSPQKWSQSGFGDLFSNISASIDVQSKSDRFDFSSVRSNVSCCFDALSWVLTSFRGFDEDCICKLAKFLHDSSMTTIIEDSTRLSSAGEHQMYRLLMEDQDQYTKELPTHGQLVSIGTLISAKLFSDQTGDQRIFDLIKSAYFSVGLPTTIEQLDSIGIKVNHITKAIKKVKNFYLERFNKGTACESMIFEIYS